MLVRNREPREIVAHPMPSQEEIMKELKNFVYVCSNKECDAVWYADPHGHCPKCIQPNGGGWSTMQREVIELPKAPLTVNDTP